MNSFYLPCIALLVFVSTAFGGTYTIQNTTVRVAKNASGTDAGDTSDNGSATIGLDVRVYIPDSVAAPAPVLVIIPGYADTKNADNVVELSQEFAAAGYIVVTPSVRGFGNSEGQVTLAGPDEINDLKTIITAMQTGSLGDSPVVDLPVNASSKFGVLGPSYGGGHSFEIVRTHVPGLTAVMPIIGWSDLYQSLAPNNVPKLSYPLGLFVSGLNGTGSNYANEMFDWMADLLKGKPEKLLTGGPEDNIDWRSVLFNPGELNVPMFVVQGWRDYLYPPEQALALAQSTNSIPFFKLYIGGLGHPPATPDIDGNEGLYLRSEAMRWFDFWLKGIDTGITNDPPITVAPEDTADWTTNVLIHAATFPLPGTVTNTWYINQDQLSPDVPIDGKEEKIAASSSNRSVVSALLKAVNARSVGDLVNVLINGGGADILSTDAFTEDDNGAKKVTFLSDPLPSDLTVIGLPVVHLYVSTKKKDACYFVQIEERSSGGNSTLVTRGAFKDSTSGQQTPHLIEFSPFAIHHAFATGSQIKLRISSRDYPFFLPNHSQSSVKIYGDAVHPSSLSMPVVP